MKTSLQNDYSNINNDDIINENNDAKIYNENYNNNGKNKNKIIAKIIAIIIKV